MSSERLRGFGLGALLGLMLITMPAITQAGGGDGGDGGAASDLGFAADDGFYGANTQGVVGNDEGMGISVGSVSGTHAIEVPMHLLNRPLYTIEDEEEDEEDVPTISAQPPEEDDDVPTISAQPTEDDDDVPTLTAPDMSAPVPQPDPGRFGPGESADSPSDTPGVAPGLGTGNDNTGNPGGNTGGSTGGNGTTGDNGSTGGNTGGNSGPGPGNSGSNAGGNSNSGNSGGNTGGSTSGNGSIGDNGSTGGNTGGNSGPGPGVGGNDGSNPDSWWGNVMHDAGEVASNLIRSITGNNGTQSTGNQNTNNVQAPASNSSSTVEEVKSPFWAEVFGNVANVANPAVNAVTNVFGQGIALLGGQINTPQENTAQYVNFGGLSLPAQEFGNGTMGTNTLIKSSSTPTIAATSPAPATTTTQTSQHLGPMANYVYIINPTLILHPEHPSCIEWFENGTPIVYPPYGHEFGLKFFASPTQMNAFCAPAASLTNTIVFEFKVTSASGSVLTDWSPAPEAIVPEGAQIYFRWDASDYERCIPYFSDVGRYALQSEDQYMTTGNTEAEGYDIVEVAGAYMVECSGQNNGEPGLDRRGIQISP